MNSREHPKHDQAEALGSGLRWQAGAQAARGSGLGHIRGTAAHSRGTLERHGRNTEDRESATAPARPLTSASAGSTPPVPPL